MAAKSRTQTPNEQFTFRGSPELFRMMVEAANNANASPAEYVRAALVARLKGDGFHPLQALIPTGRGPYAKVYKVAGNK
jgi:hypothetical protein